MRLIDADAIIPKGTRITPDNVDVAAAIRFAPTVDAVPVVRCLECKYLMFSDCYGECGKGHMGVVSPNDFCSRGERKEGAD